MARNSSSGGQVLVVLVAAIVAIIASVPKEVWILVGIVGAIWLLVLAANKSKPNASNTIQQTSIASSKNNITQGTTSITTELPPSGKDIQPLTSKTNDMATSSNIQPPESTEEDRAARERQELLRQFVRDSLKIKVTVSSRVDDIPVPVGKPSGSSSFGIPRPVVQRKPDVKWVTTGERITVQGVSFDCGMVYAGTCLQVAYNENDPCLIDPSLSIAGQGAYATDPGYWPSYARIGAAARRKYLDWLAGGRNDRSIDIGYVFLFFYGLERRVLIDAPKDDEAMSELEPIANEIERLLSIYGSGSFSFQRYAYGLLDVIRSANVGEKLYLKPVPSLPETYELPHYLKLALGQASVDTAPISADLALAWVEHQPGIYFRTAARRCAAEFDQLFRIRYRAKYGDGMVLPQNRTKLKCLYKPASLGFRGQAELSLPSNDLPDVTALTGPIDALAELVKGATEELAPYSRLLGKTPEAKDTAAARLLLPLPLWPQSVVQRLNELRDNVRESTVEMRVSELMKALDLATDIERKTMLQIARHLDSMGIAMEPDIESGARTPKLDDSIVLFNKPTTGGPEPDHIHYRTAQLTLQLAAMVAMADGEFSEPEQQFIEQQITAWEGLTATDRIRLHAHMRLMVVNPVTMGSLKKKVQELSKEARGTIAGYMASLVSMDGVITPDEVRVLEKAYKALGLESTSVFSDLHATGPTNPAPIRKPTSGGFQLDQDRVRALQHESQQVSQLLANIFTEEGDSPKPDIAPSEQAHTSSADILGLDHQHATLAHLLLSRPAWGRDELADAAADLDLMLDGALERINEASFDLYDQPLFEGDDPLEVDQTMIDLIRHEPAHSPA